MKNHHLLATGLIAGTVLLSGCQLSQPPSEQASVPSGEQVIPAENGDIFALDLENCANFTAQDAANILKVPVGQITTSIKPETESLWGCFFSDNESLFNQVGFYIEPLASSAEAAASVVEYREDISFASQYIPGGDESEPAYQDISNVGDDAVYSDVNGALYAHKGNITIQIIMPQSLEGKIEVAQTFFGKL